MRRKTRNVPVIRWRNHWKALDRADFPYLLGMGSGVEARSRAYRGSGQEPKYETRAAMLG